MTLIDLQVTEAIFVWKWV